MLRLVCMFLGCDMPIQLVLSSEYDRFDKLLPLSALLSCTNSSHQDGLMLRLVCMFLGCDMPIQLVLSSEYDRFDRL